VSVEALFPLLFGADPVGEHPVSAADRARFSLFAEDQQVSALDSVLICPVAALLLVQRSHSIRPLIDFFATPEYRDSFWAASSDRVAPFIEHVRGAARRWLLDPWFDDVLDYERCRWSAASAPGAVVHTFSSDIVAWMQLVEERLAADIELELAPLLILARQVPRIELPPAPAQRETTIGFINGARGVEVVRLPGGAARAETDRS